MAFEGEKASEEAPLRPEVPKRVDGNGNGKCGSNGHDGDHGTDGATQHTADDQHHPSSERFSPEEEASMLAKSNSHKAEANTLFGSGKYDAAIKKYDEAIAVCPNYLNYKLAVLRANVSACHLKLEEWQEAINNATTALDCLDRAEKQERDSNKSAVKSEGIEGEIISAGAAKAAPAPSRSRADDIAKLRVKVLLRRARARSELGGWANLEGAIEDYKRLEGMAAFLTPNDRRTVQAQLRALPPRAKEAQEKEMAEMWAKLKDLGNGLLRPFGLSTDNFKFIKDEKTGSYSLNFQK